MYEGLREILLAGIANRRTIIHFPNGEYPDITSGVYSGSLKLEEILNSSETLNFGECNASKFEATIADVEDISNLVISVYQKITYDPNKVDVLIDRDKKYIITRSGYKISVGRHEDYVVPIFYGRVDSAKLQADRVHRDITAYDELYYNSDINCAEWYKALYASSNSVTLRSFRDSLFAFIGIQQENVSLINDNLYIERTIETDALKFADLIKSICQLNGVFGHIDRQGVFRYIDLTSVANSYNISDNYRSNDSTYETYTVKKIDKLQIRSDEEDIGAIVGTGDNPYILQGNFLIYGKSAAELNTIATTIFNKIKNIEYRPIEAQTIYCEPYITVGDQLTFTTKRDNETINTFVLNAVLSGVQLFRQELIAEGDEYRDEVVDDVNAEIKQLQGKTLKIIKTVDEYSVKLEDIETGSAELKLTVDGLTTTVQAQDGRISTAQQTADKISWLIQTTDEDGNPVDSSEFTLTSRMAELVAENINITGFVTFTDLENEASETFINGANIITGTVKADNLIGGIVYLLTSSEETAGRIYIDDAETADYAIDIRSGGAMRLRSDYGNIYIVSEDNYSTDRDAYINISTRDGEIEFGGPYVTVYINGDEVQTSDLNKKTNIEYGLNKYDSLFDSLKPVSFIFKQNSSGRRHIGLIAQDVENALEENGIDSVDFAPLVKRLKRDNNNQALYNEYDYGLRYGELIALCIDQIQKLKNALYSK